MAIHRHRWRIVEKETQLSPWEIAHAEGESFLTRIRGDWFQKDVIVTYECSVCETQRVERI